MYPNRIVCLAAEIPEIIQRLGVLDKVVGISAYTTRPMEALGIEKVSGFRHGSAKRILKQDPDIAILTSGVQRELAAELAAYGVTMIHLNPHRLEDMFKTILLIGNLLGVPNRAVEYVDELRGEVEVIRQQARQLPFKPRVYFEEWMDPIIVGTGWVSDLIESAGGTDVFREKSASGRRATDWVVQSEEIVAAQPDIVLASWCGKPFDSAQFAARQGYANIPAVRRDMVIEIGSEVLQCGPMLLDSLKRIHEVIETFVSRY